MKTIGLRWTALLLLLGVTAIVVGLVVPTRVAADEATSKGHRVTRVENIDSAPEGLPDQNLQTVTFRRPLTTSLITVANRGGTGNRSFLVTFQVAGSGQFSFQLKENGEDVTLPLATPIPIAAVTIRCDSFADIVCRYSVSLVGKRYN